MVEDKRVVLESIQNRIDELSKEEEKTEEHPNPDKPEKFFCISSKFQVQ